MKFFATNLAILITCLTVSKAFAQEVVIKELSPHEIEVMRKAAMKKPRIVIRQVSPNQIEQMRQRAMNESNVQIRELSINDIEKMRESAMNGNSVLIIQDSNE